MRGEAMAQHVGMHAFLECGPPGGSFTGMGGQLGSDGAITGMTMPAKKQRKQPYTGLSSQPVPVSSEFVEQLRAEQHIPVFAALAVNHHALTVDMVDFHAPEFGPPESGGVERHQQV